MQIIPMSQDPNQELSILRDGTRWTLRFRSLTNVMVADVYRDGEAVLLGTRVLAGEPIVPYRYLQGAGNFTVLTLGEALPRYDETPVLIYDY